MFNLKSFFTNLLEGRSRKKFASIEQSLEKLTISLRRDVGSLRSDLGSLQKSFAALNVRTNLIADDLKFLIKGYDYWTGAQLEDEIYWRNRFSEMRQELDAMEEKYMPHFIKIRDALIDVAGAPDYRAPEHLKLPPTSKQRKLSGN